MYKSLGILFISLFAVSGYAAQNESVGNRDLFEIDYQTDLLMYNQVYQSMPSVLSIAQITPWAYLDVNYQYEKGNYRQPQTPLKKGELNLSSETFIDLKKGKWKLYGLFKYSNA